MELVQCPSPLPSSPLTTAQRQHLARNLVTTVIGLTQDRVTTTISEFYRGYPFVNFPNSVKTKVLKGKKCSNSSYRLHLVSIQNTKFIHVAKESH